MDHEKKNIQIISNVIQLGSSLAITLPASVCDYLEIDKKDKVVLTIEDVKKRK